MQIFGLVFGQISKAEASGPALDPGHLIGHEVQIASKSCLLSQVLGRGLPVVPFLDSCSVMYFTYMTLKGILR